MIYVLIIIVLLILYNNICENTKHVIVKRLYDTFIVVTIVGGLFITITFGLFPNLIPLSKYSYDNCKGYTYFAEEITVNGRVIKVNNNNGGRSLDDFYIMGEDVDEPILVFYDYKPVLNVAFFIFNQKTVLYVPKNELNNYVERLHVDENRITTYSPYTMDDILASGKKDYSIPITDIV